MSFLRFDVSPTRSGPYDRRTRKAAGKLPASLSSWASTVAHHRPERARFTRIADTVRQLAGLQAPGHCAMAKCIEAVETEDEPTRAEERSADQGAVTGGAPWSRTSPVRRFWNKAGPSRRPVPNEVRQKAGPKRCRIEDRLRRGQCGRNASISRLSIRASRSTFSSMSFRSEGATRGLARRPGHPVARRAWPLDRDQSRQLVCPAGRWRCGQETTAR